MQPALVCHKNGLNEKICDAIKTVDNLLGMGFFPGIEIGSIRDSLLDGHRVYVG